MKYLWWALFILWTVRVILGVCELAVFSPGFWRGTAAACQRVAERIGLLGMFAETQVYALTRTSEEIS